ncbi:MAG: DUF5786 family protein [Haloferacaceae archaeon]
MGFGSYDESEQGNHEATDDADESEGVNLHEDEHEGEVTFESDASTADLVGRLQEIKDE